MFEESICKFSSDKVIAARRRIISACETCGGSGIVSGDKDLIDGVPGIKEFDKCSCAKRFSIIKRRIQANLPEKYWECKFKKIQKEWDSVVTSFCSKAVENTGRGVGLYLYGPNGVGKTAMLCYVARQLLFKDIPCFYITMYDLFTMIRDGFDSDFESKLSREIMSVKFLILDEIGKMKTTEFVVFEFENMIRKRISENKSTAMSSNFTTVQLQKTFGDSLISLIRGSTNTFQISGNDLRPLALKGKL